MARDCPLALGRSLSSGSGTGVYRSFCNSTGLPSLILSMSELSVSSLPSQVFSLLEFLLCMSKTQNILLGFYNRYHACGSPVILAMQLALKCFRDLRTLSVEAMQAWCPCINIAITAAAYKLICADLGSSEPQICHNCPNLALA